MTKFFTFLFQPQFSQFDAVVMIMTPTMANWIGLWAFALMFGAFAVTGLMRRMLAK